MFSDYFTCNVKPLLIQGRGEREGCSLDKRLGDRIRGPYMWWLTFIFFCETSEDSYRRLNRTVKPKMRVTFIEIY